MSLTGSVMVITPLDGPTTSKTVLVIDEHMGIHPENYAYIKDQYEIVHGFLVIGVLVCFA